MPRTFMLLLALLASAVWPTGRHDPQPGIPAARQTTEQNYLVGEKVAQMNDQESSHAVMPSQEANSTHAHARAKITVQNSEAKPYDQTQTPSLMQISITEIFAGDLNGESSVQALQAERHDKSATMVSLQRFRGKLGGREGTFVLQGSELVQNGKIHATWFVVPGSGTGALSGLRGEGGFEGEFGKGSEGTLDYWFE